MRTDAIRHRASLVKAAGQVFARCGYDVPLEEVLKEAKLGRGTLYRHFPHRESLLVAVLEAELQRAVDFVAADDCSPHFLKDFLRDQARVSAFFHPALSALDVGRVKDAVPSIWQRVNQLYDRALECAYRNQQLRPGLSSRDLMRAVRMVAGGAVVRSASDESEIEKAIDMIIIGLRN